MNHIAHPTLSRRSAVKIMSGALPGVFSLNTFPLGVVEEPGTWSEVWDREVILAAVRNFDGNFAEAASLLKRLVGPEYHYHTNLRSTVAHPTRDSFEYALLLLEAGGDVRHKRAMNVLERVLALQNTDPSSKWYGLWGYYMEEPPEKMSPADWNWADFNGATMLMMHKRHEPRLPDNLRRLLREAIRHAAYSVRRRNVSMNYTNIAVKGTFVTLAAAEVLDDRDLGAYAIERLHRFAKNLDATGSFAEYNSPTYAQVSLANFTRLRMVVRNAEARTLSAKLEHRLWEHLSKHWHAPTQQFAGPMSRCYRTDIGAPLWLQKSLGGAAAFASLDDVRSARVPVQAEVGVLEFHCPDDLKSLFLKLNGATQHRELFTLGTERVRPIQGTTYLAPSFALGSANRSDFWVQRRPLLAYWGDGKRPARYLQARFMKDDYDFASASFYSVQNNNCVLGAVNFCTPGGDKHLSLDPVKDGEFTATQLYLQFLLDGREKDLRLLVNGEPLASTSQASHFPLPTRFTMQTGGCQICITPRLAIFGGEMPTVRIVQSDARTSIELHLIGSGKPQTIKWSDVGRAFAAFTIAIERVGNQLQSFDERSAKQSCGITQTEEQVTLEWDSPAGRLQLAAGKKIVAAAAQNEFFAEQINGSTVPIVRLNEARLDS